jgi:hypothetical protein
MKLLFQYVSREKIELCLDFRRNSTYRGLNQTESVVSRVTKSDSVVNIDFYATIEFYSQYCQRFKKLRKNVVQEIVAKTETLIDFSKIGRVVPEISDQNIRELIV